MKKVQFFVVIFTFFTLGLQIQNVQATTRYVQPSSSGSGDGSSWTNASGDLQAMINASSVGDSVWVGAGTYKPAQDHFGDPNPTNPKNKTFFVKDGVKLYGGFAGGETSFSARDIVANVTTLSGDIDNDSIRDAENVYHVVVAADVVAANGVVVDGFSITQGSADVVGPGISINGQTVNPYSGAGVYIVGGTNNILANNRIYDNWATGDGGGINTPTNTILTITNCEIYNNSAANGSGAVCRGTLTFTNNLVHGQTPSSTSFTVGGGLYMITGTVSHNVFYNNTCRNGAALRLVNGVATVTDNLFYNNVATGQAGGIEVVLNLTANVQIINNTFYNNQGTSGSGCIAVAGSTTSPLVIKNNLLWENKLGGNSNVINADYSKNGSTLKDTLSNNLLQLTYNATNYPALNSIHQNNLYSQDPLFVNPSSVKGADSLYRTSDDGLSLLANSPVINAGANLSFPSTDITGVARIANGVVDIGAYEVEISTLTHTLISPPAYYCAGTKLKVLYSAFLISPNAGNVFTLQLSDASGSFASPTTLGTLTSISTSDSIIGMIPFSQAAGTGYRVRVIASNPAFTGANNGTNLEIKTSLATANITTNGGILANPSATLPANPLLTGCQGDNITLTANVSNTTSHEWWRNGQNLAGTGNQATLTVNSSWGDYQLIAYDTNGCGQAADTVGVSLKPTPVANGGLDRNICQGNTITIGAATQANTTYTWTPNNGHLSSFSAANPTVLATLPNATKYALQVTRSYSLLEVNFTCTSGYDTVLVALKPQPTAPSIGASATTVCQGSTITVTASNVIGSIKWFVDNVAGATTNPLNLTNTSGVTKTYTAKNVGANGCSSVPSNSLNLTIQSAPTPTITSSVGTDVANVIKVCPGITNAILTANVTAGTPTFTWFNPPNVASVGSSNTLALTNVAPTTKSYYVKATYTYGALTCVKQSATKAIKQDATLVGCRTIQENEEVLTNLLSVYPNPTQHIATVQLQSAEAGETTLTLVNSLGQTVWEEKRQALKGISEIELEVRTLPTGVYLLKVENSNTQQVAKLVKE